MRELERCTIRFLGFVEFCERFVDLGGSLISCLVEGLLDTVYFINADDLGFLDLIHRQLDLF